MIKLASFRLQFEHDLDSEYLSVGIQRWFCYHSIRRWRVHAHDKRELGDELAIAPFLWLKAHSTREPIVLILLPKI